MKEKTIIQPATRSQASEIATLIMLAMNHDCCKNFAGEKHTLDDFHRMMTQLVEMDESLYSYRNTLTAVTREGDLMGICTAYDGKDFKKLRTSFIEAARQQLQQDFSDMAAETSAGEFYIDSLAVKSDYQGRGIASDLLRAVIKKHGDNQPIALLVDKGNPLAEKLYARMGFKTVDETSWGGHAMRHMQYFHNS
ncbi:acetyltransferase, GNAT family [Bacteroidales bacterium KA00344]|nr:acetyltransferase, GNAT family [Bacteroidales bacterium KA00344]